MSEFLHFEDFRAGQVFALGTRIIRAEEMMAFACEFDPQPQHVDAEAAKHSMLGSLAASGWYLCAFAMRMIVDELFSRSASRGSPGVEEIQWRRPVLAGNALRGEGEVLETRPSSRPDRGFVRMRFALWRRGADGTDERVMMFTCSVIFGRRASLSEG
jgi:acyl dehydratase